MTHTVKDRCKHCESSISPELMHLHIMYAHPEKISEINTKNKKIKFKDQPSNAHKNKVKGYLNADGTVECVLCHSRINYPELEAHMQSQHKVSWQQRVDYLKASSAQKNMWISICQGGGPGLGKKH